MTDGILFVKHVSLAGVSISAVLLHPDQMCSENLVLPEYVHLSKSLSILAQRRGRTKTVSD